MVVDCDRYNFLSAKPNSAVIKMMPNAIMQDKSHCMYHIVPHITCQSSQCIKLGEIYFTDDQIMYARTGLSLLCTDMQTTYIGGELRFVIPSNTEHAFMLELCSLVAVLYYFWIIAILFVLVLWNNAGIPKFEICVVWYLRRTLTNNYTRTGQNRIVEYWIWSVSNLQILLHAENALKSIILSRYIPAKREGKWI